MHSCAPSETSVVSLTELRCCVPIAGNVKALPPQHASRARLCIASLASPRSDQGSSQENPVRELCGRPDLLPRRSVDKRGGLQVEHESHSMFSPPDSEDFESMNCADLAPLARRQATRGKTLFVEGASGDGRFPIPSVWHGSYFKKAERITLLSNTYAVCRRSRTMALGNPAECE